MFKSLTRLGKSLLPLVIVLFTVGLVYAADPPGHCLDNSAPNFMKDETAPFTITVPEGNLITQLAVKTGVQKEEDETPFCDYLPGDLDTSCYQVTGGPGTNSVTVTKIGEGSDCKDISHIEVLYGGQGGGNGGENPPIPVVPQGGGAPQPAPQAQAPTGGIGGGVLPEAGLETWAALVLLATGLFGVRLVRSSRKGNE